MSLYDSFWQNSHGVDLRTVTPGSSVIVSVSDYGGRRRASIKQVNHAEDTYCVNMMNAYKVDVRTVSGDAFRPPKHSLENHISDAAFDSLASGDRICVWLTGWETTTAVWVGAVDTDERCVDVTGEFSALTISRSVPQRLIASR